MRKAFTIHKATHKWFTAPSTLAVCVGQKRGNTLYLNRYQNGRIVERTYCIGSCAEHLTGYGKGVHISNDKHAIERMRNAWEYCFGYDIPAPAFCEIHHG